MNVKFSVTDPLIDPEYAQFVPSPQANMKQHIHENGAFWEVMEIMSI